MKSPRLVILAFLIIITGCVRTQFSKTVSVTKDANGNVISRTEVESMTQPGSAWPMTMELLKTQATVGADKAPMSPPKH